MGTQTAEQVTAVSHGRTPGYRPRHARSEQAETVTRPDTGHGTPALEPLASDRDLAANPPTAAMTMRLGRFGRSAEPVARRLARLGDRWHTVHAVPMDGDAVLDCLLIGPGGVVGVVVTDVAGGAVWVSGDSVTVDGQYQPLVRNARTAGRRAERLLSAASNRAAAVRTVVVLTRADADDAHVQEQPRDGAVVVCTAAEVVAFVQGLPDTLDAAAIDSLHAAARHLSTWQPAAVRWEKV